MSVNVLAWIDKHLTAGRGTRIVGACEEGVGIFEVYTDQSYETLIARSEWSRHPFDMDANDRKMAHAMDDCDLLVAKFESGKTGESTEANP